ncbi:hypothetical protein Alg130_04801 [Pyrenophora tritici-repentis]|uniref:Uncharacterized protein n=1 Tax=Pyrenophora tritici-repentis TaxID=45151 RepID=A0A5M9KVP3_9PLEO|nr:hypothetical protein PtrV1_11817 [Pyrenophora tritici-repentis]KAI0578166.1 hypothetical protein Alg215_06492 [Pyrenophora tritici-repentis]KAI0585279.1 hypothetical protein Alg130_04801 [Pyrenophora tritici-repentis]KAI0611034.1 hypothetical protein TUN205_04700 [Pyrenophora tritici-repentis]KAI1511175.1 hypothetical protein Ptr86124_009579 [Pyrenophora tritici-repentis]
MQSICRIQYDAPRASGSELLLVAHLTLDAITG